MKIFKLPKRKDTRPTENDKVAGQFGKRITLSFSCFLILVVIVLTGFFFRLIAIPFDYPATTHTDEGAIVDEAIIMANQRTLLSSRYERPDNGMKKALTLIYSAFSRTMTNHPVNRTDHLQTLSSNHVEYNIVGRAYTTVLGMTLILCAFYIGMHFNKVMALTAAAVTALLSPFVVHSVYVTSDIAVTLALALCSVCALRYLDKPSWLNLLLMSFFGAVGTLDKYVGILTCGMVAVVVIWVNHKTPKQLLRQGAVAFFAYVLFMFILSPNLFLDFPNVWARIQIENRTNHLNADGLGWFGNMRFYFEKFAGYLRMPVWLVVCLLLASLTVMIIRHDKRSLIFSAVLFWWVLLSSRPIHWDRWGIPMYFGWTLVLTYGFGEAVAWLYHRFQKKLLPRILIPALSVLLFLFSMYAPISLMISNVADMRAESTIIAAAEVTERLGCTTANSMYDSSTPLRVTTSQTQCWPKDTVLSDDVLYRTDSSKIFIVQSGHQIARYKAYKTSDIYAEDLAMYKWLEDHATPIETVTADPVEDIHSTEILNSLRRLGLSLLGKNSTGYPVAIYDAKCLPLDQTILSNSMTQDEYEGELFLSYSMTYLGKGTYRITVDGCAAEIEFEGMYLESDDGTDFTMNLEDVTEYGMLIIRIPGEQKENFRSVRILQTAGGLGQN